MIKVILRKRLLFFKRHFIFQWHFDEWYLYFDSATLDKPL